MGIQGLLPLLKDIQVKTSILNFKGQTVGIDVYCWLHKGAYSCAQDLIMGKPTRAYVHYVMKRVMMLISHNITPILVFDGGHLPAKADTEADRRQRRKEQKEKGLAALREGKTSEAFDAFQRACDITPEMASNVIEECHKLNVKCIVAPYEADAQLAYLMLQGITQLTISEDSDLLLYGCNKVLYKMSADGDGVLIDMSNLSKVRTVKLASFTMEQFRWMCMLSGCDYLPSIKGMGLVKAHKLIQRHKSIKQCIRAMKIERNLYVPNDYEENFRKAELVFKYQLVFDPKERKAVPLNNVASSDITGETLDDEDRKYAGQFISQIKAIAIALGNIDPISGRSIASRTDFASGEIQMKPQKASSWTNLKSKTETQPKVLSRKRASKTEYTNAAMDFTPPDSQNKNFEETKKSLFLSPKSEAEKSLKRLRSEIAAEEVTRQDKFKRLYEAQSSVPSSQTSPTQQQQSQPSHHSAFSKSKQAKFRNPFRRNVDVETPSDTIVISRFFSKTVQPPAEAGSSTSDNKHLQDSPDLNGSFVNYLDQTNCRVSGMERKDLTLKSPKKGPQQLKINKICNAKENNIICKQDKINSDNCGTVRPPLSTAGNVATKSSTSRDKEEVDFEIGDRKEADVFVDEVKTVDASKSCRDKNIKLESTVLCEDSDSDVQQLPDDTPEISTATKNDCSQREDLSEDVSCGSSPQSPGSTANDATQSSRIPDESSGNDKNEIQENEELVKISKNSPEETSSQDSMSSSQKTRQKMKLGLSRNNCKGVGVSSFVDKRPTSQISSYLEKFKNVDSSIQQQTSLDSMFNRNVTVNTDENDLGEDVLPGDSENLTKVNSLLRPAQEATTVPRRSYPVGLRRQKKKSKISNQLTTAAESTSSLKQSKLSFDKFAFKKKSISVTTDDNGVICLS